MQHQAVKSIIKDLCKEKSNSEPKQRGTSQLAKPVTITESSVLSIEEQLTMSSYMQQIQIWIAQTTCICKTFHDMTRDKKNSQIYFYGMVIFLQFRHRHYSSKNATSTSKEGEQTAGQLHSPGVRETQNTNDITES
jgi:hypothetical protein